MKKRIINIFLSFLFAITLIVTTFCLTVLNKHFVIHIMDNENYYKEVYSKIITDFDERKLSYKLTEKEVKKDIQKYIKSRYKNEYYKFSNQDLRDDYNKYIKLNNYFGNLDICSIIYLLYLIDFGLIIITGLLFLKTKKVHNLSKIIGGNFIITIILFGLITLFGNFNNTIVDLVIKKFNHYYLATSIILLEIMIFNKLKNKIK